MSENLYQKYRPRILSQVMGQESVLKDLNKRTLDNNFSQSMLFEGYTGTGKTTLQKIIAKTILCQSKDSQGNPCNNCEFCSTVDNETISNYYFEKNASNLGIDELRQLEDLATRKTLSNSKARVFVIDELQELSNARTQKNVLKLLEKPLKDTYFILGTMDGFKIDKAIKARCNLYKLHPLSVPEISKYLLGICKQENIELDTLEKKKVILALADTCMGSMRQAISNLERVIYSDIWSTQDLMNELSIISNEDVTQMVNKLLSGDISLLSETITDDILKRMKFLLNIIFKAENKLELNAWQKQQIQGIKKVNIDNIYHSILQLNDLNKFPYLTPDIIEFQIINVIRNNNQSANVLKEEPKLQAQYISEHSDKPKERAPRR